MLVDQMSLRGTYDVTMSRDGEVTRRFQVDNLVTLQGKNLILRHLLDSPGYAVGLTHQAIGVGTTAVNERDQSLDNEYVRRGIINRPPTSSVVAVFSTYFPTSLLPDTIEEVGVFGHNATAAADSGLLFSRVLLHIDDAQGEDLLLSYTLRVS